MAAELRRQSEINLETAINNAEQRRDFFSFDTPWRTAAVYAEAGLTLVDLDRVAEADSALHAALGSPVDSQPDTEGDHDAPYRDPMALLGARLALHHVLAGVALALSEFLTVSRIPMMNQWPV